MIPGNLFTIPMWSIPCLNFSKKKKQLETLCKSFPEKKHGMQTFLQIDKVIELVLVRPSML